jgi:NADH:ubiquinone oxidoreductase subunit 4 (subunit M)
MLVPLAIIVIFLGIYPSAMLDILTTSVNTLVGFIHNNAEVITKLSM